MMCVIENNRFEKAKEGIILSVGVNWPVIRNNVISMPRTVRKLNIRVGIQNWCINRLYGEIDNICRSGKQHHLSE
jgi:parallel beta-helix repeat protein